MVWAEEEEEGREGRDTPTVEGEGELITSPVWAQGGLVTPAMQADTEGKEERVGKDTLTVQEEAGEEEREVKGTSKPQAREEEEGEGRGTSAWALRMARWSCASRRRARPRCW